VSGAAGAKKGFFEKAAQGDPNAASDIKSQRKAELEGVSSGAGAKKGFFEKAAQGDPNAASDIKSQRKAELEGVSSGAGVSLMCVVFATSCSQVSAAQAKKGFFEKAAQGDPNAASDIKSQRKAELEGVSSGAGVSCCACMGTYQR
jgi:hypothetical protein